MRWMGMAAISSVSSVCGSMPYCVRWLLPLVVYIAYLSYVSSTALDIEQQRRHCRHHPQRQQSALRLTAVYAAAPVGCWLSFGTRFNLEPVTPNTAYCIVKPPVSLCDGGMPDRVSLWELS